MAQRELTRSESKALTRQRLLDAALRILDTEGETALTTTNVTREAGIAQSSFYVHFTDMEDLLHQLIEQLARQRKRVTSEARELSRSSPRDVDRFRDTFRVPLDDMLAHPPLFRLVMRSRHDRTSPLGEWSRSIYDSSRDTLVEDMVAGGARMDTESARRRVEMIADSIIAHTEALALGHLEGRYPDRDQIVDILTDVWGAYFLSRKRAAKREAAQR